MKTFTGFEYLLIDVANHFGHDKLTFEARLEWARGNLDQLEQMTDLAEEKPLYIKGVMAIRKAQAGIPTGHLVGFDAVCSGVQIMSALTGCKVGAWATGMVDPDVRSDAYGTCTQAMRAILGKDVGITRKQAKDAMMTAYYGSKLEPIKIFGEDTPELAAFYAAAHKTAPGAWSLLQDLLASWNPTALEHAWQLPDGFNAKVKVMVQKETRVEVDELDHATFTYVYYDNECVKKRPANAANVIHSIDAYVLRSIHRRCNYNRKVAENVDKLIQTELIKRSMGLDGFWTEVNEKVIYYCDQYNRTGIVDVVILPHLSPRDMGYLSKQHLQELAEVLTEMLEYQPFEVVTIHDEYKCHPNNMNVLRKQYINMLCALADSRLIEDILSQIHGGSGGKYVKQSEDLSKLIRHSNYALC
jgi:hypothetical protein